MILFYIFGLSLRDRLYFHRDLILIPLIFVLSYAPASIFNYYWDRNIDRANNRKNHFSEDLNSNEIYKTAAFCTLLALIFALYTTNPFSSVILVLVFIIFGLLYSHPKFKFSYHPLTKLLLMLLTYSLIPALFGSGFEYKYLLTILSLSLIYASFIIYSDVKDIKGDRLHGKNTFAVILGRKLPYFGLILTISSLILILAAGSTRTLLGLSVAVGNGIFLLIQILLLNKPDLLLNRKYRSLAGYSFILFLIILVIIA